MLGLSDLTLAGELELALNATGGAVQESLILADGTTLNLDLADAIALPHITGAATLGIDGIGELSGAFAIEQAIAESGGTQQSQLLIGAKNLNALIGNADTGFTLNDGQLALYVEQDGANPAQYALQASGAAGLQG